MSWVLLDRVEIGRDEIVIIGPQLFDWKIGTEHAALGSEDCHGIGDDPGDVGGIVAMNERTEPREFADDIRTCCQPHHAGAPGRASGRRQVFQHSGVLQYECYLWTSLGKA